MTRGSLRHPPPDRHGCGPAGHLTCHLPSMRGRGLSSDHPDLSLSRVVDDMLAYVDSIGEPTGLVGWSGGAMWALAMAAQSDAVDAVAACEPVANSLMDEQERAALGEAVARTGELADEGDLTAAMRAFAGYPFTDEDIAVAEGPATSRRPAATSRTCSASS